MIYNATSYNMLPTLEELLEKLKVALNGQPIRHRSPLEPIVRDKDAFVVTRQMSGRYSLKPNISTQVALFRGESSYPNTDYSCRPRIFRKKPRYLVQNIKYEEFQIAMESHPLFNLLRNGILLNNRCNLRLFNPYGIAMCYGLDTSLLSLTSDLNIAAFYACCEQDADGVWHPVTVNDKEEKEGILYVFNMSAPFAMTPGLSSVGKQAFERCGLQKSFAIEIPREQDFRNHKFVAGFVFRHDSTVSQRFFDQFNHGNSLAPVSDILANKAREIMNSNVISRKAFDRNLRANPNDNEHVNIQEIEAKEIGIVAERSTSFTENELSAYYDNSLQIWEDFCQNLVFNDRNGQQLLDELRRVPDQAQYQSCFFRR